MSKRNFIIIVAKTLLSLIFLLPHIDIVAAQDDHGDDCYAATVVSVNSSTNGIIDSSGDIDAFVMNVTEPGRLTVYTTGGTDTAGDLYNDLFTVDQTAYLGSDNDSGSGNNFRLSGHVMEGTHCVTIRQFSPGGTGQYKFIADLDAYTVSPDFYEDDDEYWSAVEYDDIQLHNFHDPGDEDWVSMSVASGSYLSIAITNIGALSDVIVEFYDPWLQLLGSYGGEGESVTGFDWFVVEGGTYFLKIRNNDPFFGFYTDYMLEQFEFVTEDVLIHGLVTDASSGQPIANAEIITGEGTAPSLPNGNYYIYHTRGLVELEAWAPGYETHTGEFDLAKLDVTKMTHEYDIEMTRACTDVDGDGYAVDGGSCGPLDNCPNHYNPGQADGDGDMLGDVCDNCRAVYNPDQHDSNAGEDDNTAIAGMQHYGNACDPDFDNNGAVGLEDYNEWRQHYRQAVDSNNAHCDLDGDNVISLGDFNIWRSYFRSAPGPGVGD